MKNQTDLVAGLLRKAESNVVAMTASFEAGAFDAACFHAQQAAEKFLKSLLASRDIAFPHTHNLAKLLDVGAAADPSFRNLADSVTLLTPYAVELRYDFEFWPTSETADVARSTVFRVRDLVRGKLGERGISGQPSKG